MRKSFYATKKKGNLLILDRNAFDTYVAALKDDTPLEISIAEISKTRSIPQNNYFHGVICRAISEKTGYTIEEVKDILKSKHLKAEKIINGKVFEYVRHYSGLTTAEAEEFHENCRMSAAQDLEIYISLPNEY